MFLAVFFDPGGQGREVAVVSEGSGKLLFEAAAGSRARTPRRSGREGGFTLVELMVGLGLFAVVSLFLLDGFINGLGITSKSDDKGAATTLALQVMELVSASSDPYTMVGFTGLTRTALPLPPPYTSVANPSSHTYQVSVAVSQDSNLNFITVTVNVFRPADVSPFVSLTKVLHDL